MTWPDAPVKLSGLADIDAFLARFGDLNAGADANQDEDIAPPDSGAVLLADPPVQGPAPTPEPVIPVPVPPEPVVPVAPGPGVLVPEPAPPPAPPLSPIQSDTDAEGLKEAGPGDTGQAGDADGGSSLAGGEESLVKPGPGAGSAGGSWFSSSITTLGPTSPGLQGGSMTFGGSGIASVLGAATGLILRTISGEGSSAGGGGSDQHQPDQPEERHDPAGPDITPLPPSIIAGPTPPGGMLSPIIDHTPALPSWSPPGNPAAGLPDHPTVIEINTPPSYVTASYGQRSYAHEAIEYWEDKRQVWITYLSNAEDDLHEANANIDIQIHIIPDLQRFLDSGVASDEVRAATQAEIATRQAALAEWENQREVAQDKMDRSVARIEEIDASLERQHDVLSHAQAVINYWEGLQGHGGTAPQPTVEEAAAPGPGHQDEADADGAAGHPVAPRFSFALNLAADDTPLHPFPAQGMTALQALIRAYPTGGSGAAGPELVVIGTPENALINFTL